MSERLTPGQRLQLRIMDREDAKEDKRFKLAGAKYTSKRAQPYLTEDKIMEMIVKTPRHKHLTKEQYEKLSPANKEVVRAYIEDYIAASRD